MGARGLSVATNQLGALLPAMPDFAVFSLDDDAGRVETVTAPDPQVAAALVQAKYPGATTSAVPVEDLEGCNRPKLLRQGCERVPPKW